MTVDRGRRVIDHHRGVSCEPCRGYKQQLSCKASRQYRHSLLSKCWSRTNGVLGTAYGANGLLMGVPATSQLVCTSGARCVVPHGIKGHCRTGCEGAGVTAGVPGPPGGGTEPRRRRPLSNRRTYRGSGLDLKRGFELEAYSGWPGPGLRRLRRHGY